MLTAARAIIVLVDVQVYKIHVKKMAKIQFHRRSGSEIEGRGGV